MIVDLIEYAEFNGGVHFSRFGPQIPFLDTFCPKIQNWLFNVRFDT